MRFQTSKVSRCLIAIVVGVPGTIVFIPFATLLIYAGASAAGQALLGGPLNYSPPPKLHEGILLSAWGLGGAIGVLGFWAWVLQPRWLATKVGSMLILGCVLTGIVAMLPFAVALATGPAPFSWLLLLSVLGIAIGAFVLFAQAHQLRHLHATSTKSAA